MILRRAKNLRAALRGSVEVAGEVPTRDFARAIRCSPVPEKLQQRAPSSSFAVCRKHTHFAPLARSYDTRTYVHLHSEHTMSSAAFARVARARLLSSPSAALRPSSRLAPTTQQMVNTGVGVGRVKGFSTSGMRMSDPHGEESFEEFTAR